MDRGRVRLAVYQYLVEQGYDVAAMAMQDALDDEGAVREATEEGAGQLLGMLDRLVMLQEKVKPTRKPKAKLDRHEIQPDNKYCSTEYACLEGRHTGNMLACELGADGLLLTSAADRTVGFTQLDGLPEAVFFDQPTTKLPMQCPILCVNTHPTNNNLILIGGMDGSCSIVDKTGSVVQQGPKHKKYVVRVCWSPCGDFFATASYDRVAELWGRSKADPNTFERVQQFHFETNVECVLFAPRLAHKDKRSNDARGDTQQAQPSQREQEDKEEGQGEKEEAREKKNEDEEQQRVEGGAAAADGWELIMCVRADCCLHTYDTTTRETGVINMNELGDDYVSFSAMDASVSPNGKYLLVATDKDRVILLSRQHRCLLKAFYGANNGQYSNPRCCWHPSAAYVYASSQTNEVVVWEAATQKLVHRLKGHTKTIRDMHMSAEHQLLVTCSYDKTVRFWGLQD